MGKRVGLAALLAEGVSLVEDLDDAVLLGKGREWELVIRDDSIADRRIARAFSLCDHVTDECIRDNSKEKVT